MAPRDYAIRPSLLLVSLFLGHASFAAEPPVAQPATIRDVNYSGAEYLSKSELQKLTSVRTGGFNDPVRNELGRQAILRKYREEGRFYASVELAEGRKRSDTRVVYEIVEGPIVKVAEIQFRGNQSVHQEREA